MRSRHRRRRRRLLHLKHVPPASRAAACAAHAGGGASQGPVKLHCCCLWLLAPQQVRLTHGPPPGAPPRPLATLDQAACRPPPNLPAAAEGRPPPCLSLLLLASRPPSAPAALACPRHGRQSRSQSLSPPVVVGTQPQTQDQEPPRACHQLHPLCQRQHGHARPVICDGGGWRCPPSTPAAQRLRTHARTHACTHGANCFRKPRLCCWKQAVRQALDRRFHAFCLISAAQRNECAPRLPLCGHAAFQYGCMQ